MSYAYAPGSAKLRWSGLLIGVGLGGFFDGILLHQILQWHHLLSNVRQPPFARLEVQLLADGLFHLLMYLLAAFGLWLLWRARREFAQPGSDRLLMSRVLIGFGAWHILDGVLSHWLLGIHRIRMDAENVLFWDLLWFFVFGVAFVVLGAWLRRGGSGEGGGGPIAALLLAVAVIAGGSIAALPPSTSGTALVWFRPDTPPRQVFEAIAASDARILWAGRSGDLWALELSEPARARELKRHGAWWVGQSPLAIGCLAWSAASS